MLQYPVSSVKIVIEDDEREHEQDLLSMPCTHISPEHHTADSRTAFGAVSMISWQG